MLLLDMRQHSFVLVIVVELLDLHTTMAYTVMAYTVMAYAVMAYIVVVVIVMSYAVMDQASSSQCSTFTQLWLYNHSYVVIACIAVSCIFVACGMACVVVA